MDVIYTLCRSSPQSFTHKSKLKYYSASKLDRSCVDTRNKIKKLYLPEITLRLVSPSCKFSVFTSNQSI
jgi:hypothetical protein